MSDDFVGKERTSDQTTEPTRTNRVSSMARVAQRKYEMENNDDEDDDQKSAIKTTSTIKIIVKQRRAGGGREKI